MMCACVDSYTKSIRKLLKTTLTPNKQTCQQASWLEVSSSQPAGQRLKKLQAGRPKGVEKLDGLDGLDSLCEVGDKAVNIAVKAISRYFSGVVV